MKVIADSTHLCFAIVVYREKYEQTPAFQTLTASIAKAQIQGVQIFVYDNTDIADWMVPAVPESEQYKVHYYWDDSNPGVSKAYNYAVSAAEKIGCKWMVLLDQDTELPISAVAEYISSIATNVEVLIKVPVVTVQNWIFSPSRIIFKKSKIIKSIRLGIHKLQPYTIVNSGLLININFFIRIGGYNEKIKLDFADTEFVEKVKNYTRYFEVLPFRCKQNFSHNEKNIEKALTRYGIYLSDIKNCTRRSITDSLGYQYVGLLHLLKLSSKYKSLKFIFLAMSKKIGL